METKIANSHGYGSADIFFLGGFPSTNDLSCGMALSGPTGQVIESLLKPYRINISTVYRGVYIKEKMPYSGPSPKRQKLALKELDGEKYKNLLREEILDVKPNIIVPLDDIALGVVHPKIFDAKLPRGRKSWMQCLRGSVLQMREDWNIDLPDKTVKIIPTYSPSMLHMEPRARAFTRIDYGRIAALKNSSRPPNQDWMRWICRSPQDFQNFVYRNLPKNHPYLYFDIETFGGLITCISFCYDGIEAVSIPLGDYKLNKMDRAILWQMTAKLLASDIPKVNQNIKYDWIILERHGFFVKNVSGDTMLAGALLNPEFPHGLDFLVSINTDIPYYKDETQTWNPNDNKRDVLYLYNAMDSIATWRVHDEQIRDLRARGMLDLYLQEIVPLILVYKNMDMAGILVDGAQKTYLIAKYERLLSSQIETLRRLVNDDKFNPNSSQQVGKFIYDELKFPPRSKRDPETGEKTYKTDKGTLDDLSINHAASNKMGSVGAAILARIIVCRKLARIIQYLETPLGPNGRFYGTSNLAGTETGRSSSSKTIDQLCVEAKNGKNLRTIGRSLQTISKHGFQLDEEIFDDFEDKTIAADIRSMFVPDSGYVFVEGDGSGAEAREVCVLCEDWEALEAMDQKPKIHAKTAGVLFNIDPLLVTKDYPIVPKIGITYYDMGKRVRHAGNYNMKPGMLAMMTHLPLLECNLMMKKFHEANPKIKEVFHKEVVTILQKTRELVTPFGRKRIFFGDFGDDMIKEAIAYIPQSTISDQTKFTMPRLVEAWKRAPFSFLTEQHDGILAQVRKEDSEEYMVLFKKIYERPITHEKCSLFRDFSLTIPAEISVSDTNWKELKEVHV